MSYSSIYDDFSSSTYPKMRVREPNKLISWFKKNEFKEAQKKKEVGSVLPEEDHFLLHYLQLDMSNGPWIAGGCALDWYLGQPTNQLGDIDVFFKDIDQFAKFHREFNKKISGNKVSTFETANAISYTIIFNDRKRISRKIQLIKKFFTSPSDLLANFDLNICQVLTDSKSFVFGPTTEEDIKTKTLRYLRKPQQGSLRRIIKYQLYGYRPDEKLCNELETNPDFYTTKNLALHEHDEYEAGI